MTASLQKQDKLISTAENTDIIDSILNEAYIASARKTFEYQLGSEETRQEIFRERCKIDQKFLQYAEVFYRSVKKIHPNVEIIKICIGKDPSTGVPAILMIISFNNVNELLSIRNIARTLERFMWEKDRCDGYIWTNTDKDLEQSAIDIDFPIKRNMIE